MADRIDRLRVVDVEYMPETKEPGVLYVSARFELAVARCACGCGDEAVMDLGPGGWTLTRGADGPTLAPSILQYSCRAHYFVRAGRVVWC